MLIKCPKCGLTYSYGRNICHICEDHTIFFGALLNGNRREYQWNCVNPKVSKDHPIESKTEPSLEDAEFIMEENIECKWNCDSHTEIQIN